LSRWHLAAVAAAVLLLPGILGCSKDAIQVYQADKFTAQPPPSPHAAASSPASAGNESREHLHWELPPGWEEKSASGARAAHFVIEGADNQHAEVAIMPFSRMGGNDLDFVNLWRSTLNLDPITASQLAPLVHSVPIGSDEGKLYDVMDASADAAASGPAATRAHMIVAQVVRNETSWFFKLAGKYHM
jgi:hypothetical protein